ncbi:MAG: hypothetical protein R3E96_17115, partial [Planctomycetota bacterium]
EAELEAGLSFTLGNLTLTLVHEEVRPAAARPAPAVESDDLELEWEPTATAAKPAAAAPQAAPAGNTGRFAESSSKTQFQPAPKGGLGDDEFLQGAGHVSAEHVAQAGQRSLVGPILLVLGLLGGGAAGWYLYSRGESEAGPAPRGVTATAGDLLRGAGSFENAGDWSAESESEAAFHLSRSARRDGENGLSADLTPGERALQLSKAFDVHALDTLHVRAEAQIDGDVHARIGVRMIGREGENLPPSTAWGPELGGDSDGFDVVVPEGYAAARVVVAASAPGTPSEDASAVGSVALDVLTVVPGERAAMPAELDSVRLFAFGQPARGALLHKNDRILVADIGAQSSSERTPLVLSGEPGDFGFRLVTEPASTATWYLTAAPVLVAQGLSTMGEEGYLPRRLEFEASGVTDLVLGAGQDLVRVVLGAPCRVTGLPGEDGFRLAVHGVPAAGLRLKVRFGDEFREALELKDRAKAAVADGQPGLALELWKELLDRYPYETADVAEADAARAALMRAGHDALADLTGQWQRARFFGLAEGYAECRRRAEDLRAQFAGSEIEDRFAALMAEADEAMGTAQAGSDPQARHLNVLQEVLEARGAHALAQDVAAGTGPKD